MMPLAESPAGPRQWPRQELINAVNRMIRYSIEHMAQMGFDVPSVELLRTVRLLGRYE